MTDQPTIERMVGTMGKADYIVVVKTANLHIGIKALMECHPELPIVLTGFRVRAMMAPDVSAVNVGAFAKEEFPAIPWNKSNDVRASTVFATKAELMMAPASEVWDSFKKAKWLDANLPGLLATFGDMSEASWVVDPEVIKATLEEDFKKAIFASYPSDKEWAQITGVPLPTKAEKAITKQEGNVTEVKFGKKDD